MTAPDREKALGIALAQIEKQYGKGSIMRLGDEGRAPIEVIPTGSIALDVALGIGGLPRGRIIEIYGPESSGKTTVALHAVANAQAAGGIAAFIDAEHALDPEYAKALGVDTDALLVSQPDTGEQALEIADMLIRSGAIDLIVIDSVAALVPRAEIEGEMGDSHVGLQARLMSQALRKITGALSQHQHDDDLHQPAPREDRRDVRLAGDHHRRQGAEVLRVGPPGHPPHRGAQGRHRRGRQPDPGQGREEQGRAAVQAGGVRHHLRPGHLPRGLADRRRRRAGLRSARPAPGTPTRASSSARARRTSATFLRDNPDVADELEKRIKEKLGVGRAGSTWTRRCRRRSTSDRGRSAPAQSSTPTLRWTPVRALVGPRSIADLAARVAAVDAARGGPVAPIDRVPQSGAGGSSGRP